MLLVDELGQLLRIRLMKRVEIDNLGAQCRHQPVHQLSRRFRPIGGVENFSGVIEAPFEHVVVRQAHLVEFIEYGFGLLRGDREEMRAISRPRLLHLVVLQLAHDPRLAHVLAEADQKNRRLFDSGKKQFGLLPVVTPIVEA